MNSDLIRVGLVGYGLAGSVFHAPLIRATERMRLVAVETSRRTPHSVQSFDELVERSDLVVVASPNTTHFPIAKQALEAGRHVVVDKPLTVTVPEADELIRLASQRNLVLSAFHNRRWDADFLTMRQVLPRLGEVMLFEANWDRFRPAIKPGWREIPGDGTGLFNDLGPHLIDQALNVFGRPDAIQADIDSQRPAAAVDDYFDVTLHYGRTRVCLRSSTLIASPRPRFSIHGAGGSFVKFGLDPQEQQLNNGTDPLDEQFGIDPIDGTFVDPDGKVLPVQTVKGNYRAYYDGIAAAILDGAPIPVSANDAREGLALIHLARRASDEGRRLAILAANSTAA
jgi:scyllo-inositol 2-dehydrogenase (NADP+)